MVVSVAVVRCCRQDPTCLEALLQKGLALLELGRPSEAEHILREGLQANGSAVLARSAPESQEAHSVLDQLETFLQDEALLQKVQNLRETGNEHVRQGQYEAAAWCYEDCLQAGRCGNALTHSLEKSREIAEVLWGKDLIFPSEVAERAKRPCTGLWRQLRSAETAVVTNLSLCCLQGQKDWAPSPERAIQLCTIALTYDPEHVKAMRRMAHAYCAMHRYEDAEAILTSAVRQRPKDAALRQDLERARSQADDVRRRAKDWEREAFRDLFERLPGGFATPEVPQSTASWPELQFPTPQRCLGADEVDDYVAHLSESLQQDGEAAYIMELLYTIRHAVEMQFGEGSGKQLARIVPLVQALTRSPGLVKTHEPGKGQRCLASRLTGLTQEQPLHDSDESVAFCQQLRAQKKIFLDELQTREMQKDIFWEAPWSCQTEHSWQCVPLVRQGAWVAGGFFGVTSEVLLVDSDHGEVDPAVSLQAAGLEEGDHLTAIVVEAKIATAGRAFALFCSGGNQVVTWGEAASGGDSSEVQDQLKGVQQIQGTESAFAAILADGSVVTWGDKDFGGDSSEVQDQLKGVQQVQSAVAAFAAVLADGSVVTWGFPYYGGDSSEVQDQLKGVQQVQSTGGAFAAILVNGSVVTWGAPNYGGDSSEVQDQLKGVQQIQGTESAFAAILANGSVVTWGDVASGGDSSKVQDRLRGVQQVQATLSSFAAILADGSVVTWGDEDTGGDSSKVQDQLKGVQHVQANGGAFAAILADGSLVTWGKPGSGGDSSKVQDRLKGVQQLQATSRQARQGGFAAILGDWSVVTWGNPHFGGDSSKVQDQLKDVQQVQATLSSFAAILADGSVVTWGDEDTGGDNSAVADRFAYVRQFCHQAFRGSSRVCLWMRAWGVDAVVQRARSLASPRVEIAASETTRSLLSQIQGDGNVSTGKDGVLQSCTGGLLRLSMPGDVFVGQGLRVGTVPAVVVRFDRTGVVAAALGTAEAGASVSSCGMLTLERRDWPAGLMLATSQAPDTAVVFVAHRPQSRLQGEFADLGDRSAPFVALSAEPSSPAPERYFLLLAALRLAVELGSSHRNVVLAVDDAVSFAEAAAELKVPPMSAAQDLDMLNTTYAATFQLPILRVLRGELRGLLRRSNSLKEKLAAGKDLGFQAEVEDVDSLGSDTVARALLTQSKPCSIREVVVLACASVVYYFPRQRPSRSEVAAFQAEVVDLIRSYHPSIWEAQHLIQGSLSQAISYAPTAVSSQPDRGDLSAIDGAVEVIFFDFDGTLTETPGTRASHASKMAELMGRTPLLRPRLQRLREAGIILGVVSKSTEQTVSTALQETGLMEFFNGPIVGKAAQLDGKAGIIQALFEEGGTLAHLGSEAWEKALLIDDDISELVWARDIGMQTFAAPAQGGLQADDFHELFRSLGLEGEQSQEDEMDPMTPLAQPRTGRRGRPPVRLEEIALEDECIRSLWTQGLVGQKLGLQTDVAQKQYSKEESAPKIVDYYDVTEELGQGSFGTAYVGHYRSSGIICAVKLLDREHVGQHYHKNFVERDTISLLLQMARESPNPHVVQLLDSLMSDAHFFVVMELLEGPDLFEHLTSYGPGVSLTEEHARFIIQNSLSALAHIHSTCGVGIIHRDVKPENLRFRSKDPDSELVLVDFGLCCPASDAERRTIVGSLLYVAPEVFSRRYDAKADLWSIGVVMYILLTGRPPWKQNLNVGFVPSKKVLNGEAAQAALNAKELEETPAALELLRGLLVTNPESRLSAKAALQCRWLGTSPAAIEQDASPKLLSANSLSFCSTSKYSHRTPKKVAQADDDPEEDQAPEYELPEPLAGFAKVLPKGILRHEANTNYVLTLHLILELRTPGLYVAHIGEQSRSLEEGVLVFDPSYAHWIENTSEAEMLLFYCHFYHPQISEVERYALLLLAQLMEMLQSSGVVRSASLAPAATPHDL
eukprot:s2096_g9.t1